MGEMAVRKADSKYVEARVRAVKKYDKTHYDVGSYKLPKGTREEIAALGMSTNGFLTEAVAEKLGRENAKTQSPETQSGIFLEIAPEDLETLKAHGDPEEMLKEALRAILEECKAGIR